MRRGLIVSCVSVINAAIKLRLQNVVEYLENYLNTNETAWILPRDFFEVVEERNLLRLKEKALQLACKYPKTVLEPFGGYGFYEYYVRFLNLKEETLIQLLQRNDLGMDEPEILNRLISWGIGNIEHYKKKRVADGPSILDKRIVKRPMNFMRRKEAIDLKETLRNCIPHIRFFHMSPEDYIQTRTQFRNVIPEKLDDKIINYFFELRL